MTALQIKTKVEGILREVERVRQLDKNANVVVFVDEFNTTSQMGLLKEIFVDKHMDGKKLPDGVFWIAAMNQFIESKVPKERITYTGTGAVSNKPYAVRPEPMSMSSLILDFPHLRTSNESRFLQAISELQQDRLDGFTDLILFGQQFLRDHKMERIEASIRDIMRALQLYKYFRTSEAGKYIITRETNQEQSTRLKSTGLEDTRLKWRCMYLAMGLTYFFRLESSLRADFLNKIQEEGRKFGCPLSVNFNEVIEQSKTFVFCEL
eukprot:TRINITY_DN2602_c0_g1_i2.p1 TRINITY_DN2602_c0_g1~~TRINITY_DN2602_c0_g1_i2.p1  ORF type:complete len:283 (-),score=55.43 TRINITY_DN2602_c0_g1_i2:476-1270(-)